MPKHLPNFDTLLRLSNNSPEQLERLRQCLIEDTISSAPQHLHHKLRGLQFQIDSQRQLAKTPMAACLLLSRHMWSTFEELNRVLNCPNQALAKRRAEQAHSAAIIPFRPR